MIDKEKEIQKYTPIDTKNSFIAECVFCHFHFFTSNINYIKCKSCESRVFQIYELKPINILNLENSIFIH